MREKKGQVATEAELHGNGLPVVVQLIARHRKGSDIVFLALCWWLPWPGGVGVGFRLLRAAVTMLGHSLKVLGTCPAATWPCAISFACGAVDGLNGRSCLSLGLRSRSTYPIVPCVILLLPSAWFVRNHRDIARRSWRS